MLADLALVGFGHVGRRFVRLLDELRPALVLEHDLTCRIVGISTARHGAAFDGAGVNVDAALSRVEAGLDLSAAGDGTNVNGSMALIERLEQSGAPIRVMIETTTLDIDAGEPAISHVRAALRAGCHAVTANKGPAAFACQELQELAYACARSFLFEGAVMDGIPIFNLVRETLPAVRITGFRGVVNSTTNHVLTALERGESFEAALARMQAEGIAEADPSLDLDGWDAAAKTAALVNAVMGERITPRDVDRTGIGPHSATAAVQAVASGRRLKLVASARLDEDGTVRACVRPQALGRDDPLAELEGMANGLVLETDVLGPIAITQLQGSLTATAYALVSDLVTVRRRHGAPAGAPARRSR